MRRTMRRSPIRCSTNFTNHSWEMDSKNPRTSASSTHSTFLVISARCGIPLEVEVRLPQHFDVVHVMKQRSESHLLVSLCYLPYSLQPTYHPGPALSPESGGLSPIPLGQFPFLHPLRHR